MSKHLHYGSHKFSGYHSLCPNRCRACNSSNPSLPGQPLPDKCASCGTSFPPIKWRSMPAVHADPKAAEIPANFETTGTKSREIRRQKVMLAKWKKLNEDARK